MKWEAPESKQELQVQLVLRAQAGDATAFDELARQFRPALLAVVFLRVSNRDDAQDLVQEVLATGWRQLASLREPAQIGTWLRTIAANACNSWYRREVAWPASLDEMDDKATLVDPQPRPLEVLLARERGHSLRRALNGLTEQNRVALLMHVWGGYSYQEISDLLDVPVTTVEGRIFRARIQLRRGFPDDDEELLYEST